MPLSRNLAFDDYSALVVLPPRPMALLIISAISLNELWPFLNVADLIKQYGEAARLGMASNSLVSAANARRLGWSPRAPSLAEYFEGLR
jgi:hypothetical protein